MTVSADKKPVVLIVHGVQLGDDSSLDQDKVIRKLINSRLTGEPLDFDVDLYKYENLSDTALDKFKNLSRVIMSSGIGSILAPSVIDIVGDVAISLANSSTADAIRKGLREQILSHYEAGSPLYVVAHSLGSVYVFDVLNELISKHKDLFDSNDPRTWPVQGLVTIGSPLGLSIFKKSGRKVARNLGKGDYQLTWLNYFDVSDPVVSGDIFGKKESKLKIAEQYKKSSFGIGWFIQDMPVDTGKNWLFAHTAYWDSAVVGDGLVNMMT